MNYVTVKRFILSHKAAIFLLALGLVRMVGDLARSPVLSGIGMASNASPAPNVFSSLKGMEPFSSRFFIEWQDSDGNLQSVEMTPELYARLEGPYNRRNAYGAALAGGPVIVSDPFIKPLFDSVANRALAGNAPLLREIGINPSDIRGPVRLRYINLPGTNHQNLPTLLEVKSNDRA